MSKIYINFKITLFLLCLHTVSFCMEEISVEIDKPETLSTSETGSFTLSTDKHTFLFEAVDFFNLSPKNRALYVKATNDFDAVSQMFDPMIACLFKAASWFKEDIAYEAMIEKMTKSKEENPEHYQRFTWFIFNVKTDSFVGSIGLQTPAQVDLSSDIIDKFQIHSNALWELGGALTKPYRGRKIASKLAPLFLKKLKSFSFLQNEWVTFCTMTTNIPMRHLASKYGFSHFESKKEAFDFSLFTYDIDIDVFGMQIKADNDETSSKKGDF